MVQRVHQKWIGSADVTIGSSFKSLSSWEKWLFKTRLSDGFEQMKSIDSLTRKVWAHPWLAWMLVDFPCGQLPLSVSWILMTFHISHLCHSPLLVQSTTWKMNQRIDIYRTKGLPCLHEWTFRDRKLTPWHSLLLVVVWDRLLSCWTHWSCYTTGEGWQSQYPGAVQCLFMPLSLTSSLWKPSAAAILIKDSTLMVSTLMCEFWSISG